MELDSIINLYLEDPTDKHFSKIINYLNEFGKKEDCLKLLEVLISKADYKTVNVSIKHLGLCYFSLKRLVEAQYHLELFLLKNLNDTQALLNLNIVACMRKDLASSFTCIETLKNNNAEQIYIDCSEILFYKTAGDYIKANIISHKIKINEIPDFYLAEVIFDIGLKTNDDVLISNIITSKFSNIINPKFHSAAKNILILKIIKLLELVNG